PDGGGSLGSDSNIAGARGPCNWDCGGDGRGSGNAGCALQKRSGISGAVKGGGGLSADESADRGEPILGVGAYGEQRRTHGGRYGWFRTDTAATGGGLCDCRGGSADVPGDWPARRGADTERRRGPDTLQRRRVGDCRLWDGAGGDVRGGGRGPPISS